MPIREKSFRIGAGRYLQEKGALSLLGEEVLRLGKKPLIIGGKTALSLTRKEIVKSLDNIVFEYEINEHTGTCNDKKAKNFSDHAKKCSFDVIVGVGGGVIMDFAKLIAHFAHLPVINIPTSSATCAAYTPLSVRYTPEGRTVGSKHYEYEVNCVIVDPEIIITQPKRLLISGAFDTLAKFVEIKQRFNENVTDFPLGLDWAHTLSKKSFYDIVNGLEECISDMEKGLVSDNFEKMIFNLICTTGVISGIARGSNQTALAHKFYEATKKRFFEESRPFLHGEIVGVGLILQNFFNGEKENNDFLISVMKKYSMPSCIKDMNVLQNDETKKVYFDELSVCSAIEDGNEKNLLKLQEALDYLWSIEQNE